MNKNIICKSGAMLVSLFLTCEVLASSAYNTTRSDRTSGIVPDQVSSNVKSMLQEAVKPVLEISSVMGKDELSRDGVEELDICVSVTVVVKGVSKSEISNSEDNVPPTFFEEKTPVVCN